MKRVINATALLLIPRSGTTVATNALLERNGAEVVTQLPPQYAPHPLFMRLYRLK